MFKVLSRARLAVFLAFTTVFASSFNPVNPRVNKNYCLFFDLGDVLIAPSKSKSFSKNKTIFIKYALRYGVNQIKIKQRLFELMDHQTGYPPRGTATNNGECLPAIMCDWFEGKIDGKKFIEIITNIDPNDKFFKSKIEGQFLIATALLMLSENLVEIHEQTKLVDVLCKCKAHDLSRVAILSNMDKNSIPLLKQKFPEIFSGLQDHQIIFSGECGCKKPDYSIYQLAASQMGVHPSQCVLIDDQPENIVAANEANWRGIWHQNHDITTRTISQCYGFPCDPSK